jgi:hypothetical protein
MARKNAANPHNPTVRDGLCRHIRSKGMLVNIAEPPESDSNQKQYLQFDPNALAWDSTIWWCEETSKPVGPDDRPCHGDRCIKGRACYAAEDPAVA